MFIHCPVNGHLPCFQLWAIKIKAIMNVLIQVFFWICVFIFGGKYVGAELLGYRGVVYSSLYKTDKKVSSTILFFFF